MEIGKILRLNGGIYTVEIGSETVLCSAKGRFRHCDIVPTVGDEVEILREEGKSSEESGGVIASVLPRKNILIRPPLANLDMIFVVASVKSPDPSLLALDKLLSVACHNGIRAVLVFTKKELDPEGAEKLCDTYRKAGFSAEAVTCEDPEEIASLLIPYIKDRSVCALAGASGVGKSTLIQLLFPQIQTETGDLSEKTRRGRHTTRQSILYPIPLPKGRGSVYVADTPGFSLLDFDKFFFMEKEDLPLFLSRISGSPGTMQIHQMLPPQGGRLSDPGGGAARHHPPKPPR